MFNIPNLSALLGNIQIPPQTTTPNPAANNPLLQMPWFQQLLAQYGGQQGNASPVQTAPQPFGYTAPVSGPANPFMTLAANTPDTMFINQAAADLYKNAMGAAPTGAASTDPIWQQLAEPSGTSTKIGSRSRVSIPPKRLAQMGRTAYSKGTRGPAKSNATMLSSIGGLGGNGGGQFNLAGIFDRLRGLV